MTVEIDGGRLVLDDCTDDPDGRRAPDDADAEEVLLVARWLGTRAGAGWRHRSDGGFAWADPRALTRRERLARRGRLGALRRGTRVATAATGRAASGAGVLVVPGPAGGHETGRPR